MSPVVHSREHRAGPAHPGRCRSYSLGTLKELFLLRERRIERRFDGSDSTLGLPHVKAVAQAHAEHFVSNVQRGHHGDALGAGDLAGELDLVHLGFEVGHGLQQRLALLVAAATIIISYRILSAEMLLAILDTSGRRFSTS